MNDLLKFIESNQETYKAWVGSNADLQKGSDLIKPLIPVYEAENNTKEISNGHCKDCILDMIRWALKKLKEPEIKLNKNPKKKIT